MQVLDRVKSRLDRPITMIGLMGSGKSLIGRQLSAALDLTFIDSDQVVEQTAGISISEIFELAGEAKFREMERRAIRDAVDAGTVVLSVGGGAVCNAKTATLLNSRSIIVWLKANPETLMARIGSTASRPLLQGGDPLAILQQLAEERQDDYAIADLTVVTDGMSGNAASDAVLRALDSHLAVT
jgi:shikimate kinase